MCFECGAQAHLKSRIKVLALLPAATATTAAEHGRKEIGKAAFIFKTFKTAATAELLRVLPLLPCMLLMSFAVLPVLAVLIVFFSFLRVAQHFVGLIDLLKFFVRRCIVGIGIGMELTCELAVCFFYFIRCGYFCEAKHFIVIYEFHY